MDEAFWIILWLTILPIGFCLWLLQEWWFSRPTENPPTYCEICGCKIKSTWLTLYTRYDTETGQGYSKQEGWWECPKKEKWDLDYSYSENKNPHYYRKSGLDRVVKVQSNCDLEYEHHF